MPAKLKRILSLSAISSEFSFLNKSSSDIIKEYSLHFTLSSPILPELENNILSCSLIFSSFLRISSSKESYLE